MRTNSTLWKRLRDKAYREAFVEDQVKRGIPFQIRSLLRSHELSQKQVADRAGITQGVVSRAANPNYGDLTINTIIRVAAGFDVAFVGQFVPFSELVRWHDALSAAHVATFEEEDSQEGERENAEIAAALRSMAKGAREATRLHGVDGYGGPTQQRDLLSAADIRLAVSNDQARSSVKKVPYQDVPQKMDSLKEPRHG